MNGRVSDNSQTARSEIFMADSADTLPPVTRSERLAAVDTIRGFAVLGILLMNILSFGLPEDASDNPTVAGGATGINYAFWFWNTVLFEGKMRAIFSMLFGAGLIIMSRRATEAARAAGFADIWLRRNLWLLVFGVVHAYFIWEGDILYPYALCGFLIFSFRKLSPKALLLAGALVISVLIPKGWLEVLDLESQKRDATLAEAAKARGQNLSAEQEEAIKNWNKELVSPKDEIDKEIRNHTGGYWQLFLARHHRVAEWQSTFFYRWLVWDVLGMMLIGMGLMKLGFFSAELKRRTYLTLGSAAVTAGWCLVFWMTSTYAASNYEPIVGARMSMWYEPARALVAVGYASFLALICRVGFMSFIRRNLTNVGQMAFTNYLLASVICSTLFYGYGFGWFAQLERHQLYYVVAGVWAIQFVLSALWLQRFRTGPLEWAWRSLTHGRRQPMRHEADVQPATALVT